MAFKKYVKQDFHKKSYERYVSDSLEAKNGRWKNGIYHHSSGYIFIYVSRKKYIREHRLVMEKHIDRKLSSKEVIHHIDGNKANNRIDNLLLFATQKEHQKFHRAEQKKQNKRTGGRLKSGLLATISQDSSTRAL